MARDDNRKPSKLRRIGEVAEILASYGFDFLTHPTRRKKPNRHNSATPHEKRFREVLEKLGPTYVKLGQAASTRPDIIPPEYAAELAKLQDSAAEVPYEEIAQVIREEFGRDPEMIFAEFEKQPRAAASIAQVHNAVLSDGTQVVAKIQRPGIRPKVEEDLLVLHDVVHFVSEHVEEVQNHDLEGWFDEFEFSLRNEMDFTFEGDNAERFRQNFCDDPTVYIPTIFWEYTTEKVLTMERVDGTKVSDRTALIENGTDPQELARTCARVILKMVYEDGFFHADPHAGNFFILPDGRVALVDMGMVGVLDSELRDSLMRIALNVSRFDPQRLTDEIIAFAHTEDLVARQPLEREISRLLQRNRGSHRKVSMARMLNDVMDIAAKNGLILPSSIALLARCFTMAEGLGHNLDPEFDMTAFAEPYLREIYEKRYSPTEMIKRFRDEAPVLADLALRFPRRAEKIFTRIEKGDLTVVARVYEQDKILHHIHMAAHRIAMSMLAAGVIAAVAVIAAVYKPRDIHGWGSILLIGLAVILLGVAFSWFRTIWKTEKEL